MKLKIDENLPADCAVLLRNDGFEADTVADERMAGADDNVIATKVAGREVKCRLTPFVKINVGQLLWTLVKLRS